MRNAFIEELVSAAQNCNSIALVVGDLGYKVVEPFAERFPERFFNAGIAEQNMMGLAAGLASEGMHVFVYSIANFPTFRCAEQIRNDVDYHNLPVTIVSVGGGLAYGNLGYSHHAVQDYALMRVLPNILIAAPGDPMEARACTRYLVSNPQPSYLRLGKSGEKNVHMKVPHISPGVWVPISDLPGQENKIIVSTGAALETVVQWKLNGLIDDYKLHTLPLWGMRHKNLQPNQVNFHKEIVTVEDHLIDGGFSSWMCESLLGTGLINRINAKGLNHNIFNLVGKQLTLNIAGGLDPSKFS